MPDLRYCKKEPVFQTVLGNCPSSFDLLIGIHYIIALEVSSFSSTEEGKEGRKKPERKVSVILTCLVATVSQILAEADTDLNYFLKA